MKAAICAIVRNEAPYIGEWLAHHLILGFDRALVFDNESTDRTRSEVELIARIAPVEIRHWPDAGRVSVQTAAYEQACRELAGEVEWVAFLDADEFLISQHGEQLIELLTGRHGFAGIGVHWLMFGSSGHEMYPDGLVLEAFRMRSTLEFGPNRHIKSIVRPEAVLSCSNAHAFEISGRYCDSTGAAMRWEVHGISAGLPKVENWRIHHYFSRHRGSWAAKIARHRPKRDMPHRTIADFLSHDQNDVYDDTALRYVPAVRAMLDEVGR